MNTRRKEHLSLNIPHLEAAYAIVPDEHGQGMRTIETDLYNVHLAQIADDAASRLAKLSKTQRRKLEKEQAKIQKHH